MVPTSLDNRSFRLVFFFASKCCFPARLLTIFPLPVTRNRFAEACRKLGHKVSSYPPKCNGKYRRKSRAGSRTLWVFILYPFAAKTVNEGWLGEEEARPETVLGRITGSPRREFEELRLLFPGTTTRGCRAGRTPCGLLAREAHRGENLSIHNAIVVRSSGLPLPLG